MINFIQLFNEVALKSQSMNDELGLAKEFDDKLADLGIDSLEGLLICMYLCDMYGIPEEEGKKLSPVTLQDIYSFLQQHKTKEPESLEAALEAVE